MHRIRYIVQKPVFVAFPVIVALPGHTHLHFVTIDKNRQLVILCDQELTLTNYK